MGGVVNPQFNLVDDWWKTGGIVFPITTNIIMEARPNPRDCPGGYDNGVEAAFVEYNRIVIPWKYQSAAWKSHCNFNLIFIGKN